MNNNDWLLIPLTFITGLLFNLLVLPDTLMALRVDLLLIVLIYWSLRTPEKVGVSIGWVVGLLMDVSSGGVLGLMALVYTLTAYICLMLHQQIRMLPMFQQTLLIGVLLLAGKVLGFGVLVLCGRLPMATYWLPVISGALVWPLLCGLLAGWRKKPVNLL